MGRDEQTLWLLLTSADKARAIARARAVKRIVSTFNLAVMQAIEKDGNSMKFHVPVEYIDAFRQAASSFKLTFVESDGLESVFHVEW